MVYVCGTVREGDESSERIPRGGQRYPVDRLVPPYRAKARGFSTFACAYCAYARTHVRTCICMRTHVHMHRMHVRKHVRVHVRKYVRMHVRNVFCDSFF